LRVLERNSGISGQFDKPALIFCGKRPAAFVEHFERTEPVATRRIERHAEDGLGAVPSFLVDAAIDFAGFARAADATRLARLNDLADDAGVIRQTQLS